jgi:hypothetical protein
MLSRAFMMILEEVSKLKKSIASLIRLKELWLMNRKNSKNHFRNKILGEWENPTSFRMQVILSSKAQS